MSGDAIGSCTWGLQKYARFVGENETNTQPNESWKFYDNSSEQLELLLTASHHLVICKGQQILENVSLFNAVSWMKGVTKGDSMLIIYKMQDENHKFRVKFSGVTPQDCIETCSSCILRLAKFFPIKRMNMYGQEETAGPTSGSGDKQDELKGDVTVGRLAEVVSSEGVNGLPAAYRQASSHLPSDHLSTMLRLCLTDANFPAFVGQVEKELEKLKK